MNGDDSSSVMRDVALFFGEDGGVTLLIGGLFVSVQSSLPGQVSGAAQLGAWHRGTK